MKVIGSAREMQEWSLSRRRAGSRLALVPTMGSLHEGHLSLMRLARSHAELVVVSIFVNPTQFGPGEDYSRYPRPAERDRQLCRQEGVDVLFAPAVREMYAPDHSVFVEEIALSRGLCGAFRPSHFRGVATVVSMLFNLTLPDVAVFGQKDAQQTRVIRRMVRDLHFPVEIVEGPVARECDGLAMSSRNAYLSRDERLRAACLARALRAAVALWRSGVRDAEALKDAAREAIEAAAPDSIEYIEIVDSDTLEPVDEVVRPALLALAVRFGRTRLIDNTLLGGSTVDAAPQARGPRSAPAEPC